MHAIPHPCPASADKATWPSSSYAPLVLLLHQSTASTFYLCTPPEFNHQTLGRASPASLDPPSGVVAKEAICRSGVPALLI
mmetsp:Transcript_30787/g.69493  ORF Transcript_30787/g.69493 Transcript_30787/m.69493 type:complete len:81 (-) Transcript_30787:611-853(-)